MSRMLAVAVTVVSLLLPGSGHASAPPISDARSALASIYLRGTLGAVIWLWETREVTTDSLVASQGSNVRTKICAAVVEERTPRLFDYGCTDRTGSIDEYLRSASANATMPSIVRRIGSSRILGRSVLTLSGSWKPIGTPAPSNSNPFRCVGGEDSRLTAGVTTYREQNSLARMSVTSRRFGTVSGFSDYARMWQFTSKGIDQDLPAPSPFNGCY